MVADTLSRPPRKEAQEEEEENIEECLLNTIQVDFPRYTAEDLREQQKKDDELKSIIEDFELPQDSERFIKWTNSGYFLNNGVLYKYSSEISEDASEEAQFVVPKQNVITILQTYHDDPTAGHYGINRTINRIAKRYFWTRMRKDISDYVGKCVACQQYKANNLKPAGILQTTASNQRFEVIAIDLIGPLPVSQYGQKYIFVVEDVATGWIELFALKRAEAESCSNKLIFEIFFRYGIARRLISDNGSQFISAVFQKLTYCMEIQQSFVPFYHQSNPCERKNRDIRAQLSILVANDHTNWPDKLRMVRFAMNTAKNESTGFTAAFLTFGRELRTIDDMEHDLRTIATSENFVAQITPKLLQISDTLKDVKENKNIVHNRSAKYFDGKHRPDPGYKSGDLVWITSHKKSNSAQQKTDKFFPRREGPYVILQKLGSATYEIGSKDDKAKIIGKYHSSAIFPVTGMN